MCAPEARVSVETGHTACICQGISIFCCIPHRTPRTGHFRGCTLQASTHLLAAPEVTHNRQAQSDAEPLRGIGRADAQDAGCAAAVAGGPGTDEGKARLSVQLRLDRHLIPSALLSLGSYSPASKICRISITSPSSAGQRCAHFTTSSFDFASTIQ